MRRIHTLGLALALVLACAGPGISAAWAAPCPGASSCPYASAQIIGMRAEGVLRLPEAVAVDTQGYVYVADQLSFVVQKFTAAGQFVTEWGSFGGARGQFGPIGGLATDAEGNVYVVDSSHNRIEKFNSEGGFVTSWGGSGVGLGHFHFGSSTIPSEPPGGGIAIAGNYVYVADTGNDRIERFNLNGEEAMQWGSPGGGAGEFNQPRGLAANSTEVLVADDDNHRIERFDPNGNFEDAIGSRGAGEGQFNFPYGVALDAAGNAYVADNNNHRVVKLTPELTYASAWGSVGSGPGQLDYPRALASDPAGDVYVADTANDRVEVVDTNGNLLRSLGAPGDGLGVFTSPRGVATDPSGGLLVADSDDNRVEVFAPGSDAFTAAFAPAGASFPFDVPEGIGVDPRGAVYVADSANERVVEMWGDGTFLSALGEAGGAQLNTPGAVAVAPASGTVYVADSADNRVLVYGPEGALRAKWGGGGGNGAGGSGPGEFEDPRGIAVDAAGNVYVADTGNDRVQKLSPSGSVEAMWGEKGSRAGAFNEPTGVAVDARGEVYVVDSQNNRVEAFDSPSGHLLAAWGLRGSDLGEFSQPSAIAVDCAGAVYVADTNNNRVERFNPLSAIAANCLPAGSWPPPLNVAPVVRVALSRRVGVLARRALALEVSCARGCKVLVTATLATTRPRRSVALLAAARPLPAKAAGHVRLRLTSVGLRRLRVALGRRAGLLATVRIVAVGPTGRRTTLARSYAVRR